MKKYIVREGDTLWSISKATGVRLNLLIAANPQIRDPNDLRPGMVIAIPELDKGKPGTAAAGQAPLPPATGHGMTATPVPAGPPAPTGPAGAAGTAPGADGGVPPYFGFVWPHVVRPGETWESIQQMYNVTTGELQSLNPMAQGRPLRPGDIVYLPGTAVPGPAETGQPMPYGTGAPGTAPTVPGPGNAQPGTAPWPGAGEGWPMQAAPPPGWPYPPAPWPAPPPAPAVPPAPAPPPVPAAPGGYMPPAYPQFGPHSHYPFRLYGFMRGAPAGYRPPAYPVVGPVIPYVPYAYFYPGFPYLPPWTRPQPGFTFFDWDDSSSWESSSWDFAPAAGGFTVGTQHLAARGGEETDAWSDSSPAPFRDDPTATD